MERAKRRPFSIGNVAELTGVNRATLRSWETFGLLAPSKGKSGHRTFDGSDVERIRRIETLRRVQGLSLPRILARLQADGDSDHSEMDADLDDAAVKAARSAVDDALPDRDINIPVREKADQKLARAAPTPLGRLVRSLRTGRGMSLADLARDVGMTSSHLSMFERGLAFPSLSKLAGIAKVFDRSLAEMLGGTSRIGVPITPKGGGRRVDVFGPDVSVEQLNVKEALMDCEIWSLQPGSQSNGSYSHSGQEFIFVLEGEFELSLESGPYEILREGYSAYFESTKLHRWRNNSNARAVLLWINSESGFTVGLEKGSNHTATLAPRPAPASRADFDAINIPSSARTFRVVDTHTAGHPTRVLVDALPGLEGETVREQRDFFKARYDHLRPLLLHEPRGHAATFGLIPVTSKVADFGAIFVSSYSYLDMCGHGTIGFARTLAAMGQLPDNGRFTLETPAGIVSVSTTQTEQGLQVSFENVPSRLERLGLGIVVDGQSLEVDLAYGGGRYALISAASAGLTLSRGAVGQAMAKGARIKAAVNSKLARGEYDLPPVDSILFFEDIAPGHWRQLIVLADNKYDRSPCGTGASARIAERVARGILSAGDKVLVENILGLSFAARVLTVTPEKPYPSVVPVISGMAHLSALSTLIIEYDEPLPAGFLCH